MRIFLYHTAVILRAMLRLEFRVRELLTILATLSVIVSVIIGFGMTSAFLDPEQRQRLFPSLVWISFMLNASVILGRSFEHELEHRALDGFRLGGVSPGAIFLAKTISTFLVVAVAHSVSVTTLGMLLSVSILSVLGSFLGISTLVLLAYSALATLLAAVTSATRVRQALLPVVLLPLLFPLFFCAVELTTVLLQEGSSQEFVTTSPWWWLLGGLTLLYGVGGVLLFEAAIEE